MREFIGNTLLHFGWAFFGQECSCGGGVNLNRLARYFRKQWMADMDDSTDFDIEGYTLFVIGSFFVDAATHNFEDVL